MTYDIRRLGLTDTLRCGAELRSIGNASRTLEQGVQSMAAFLHAELVDGRTGTRACALVRGYMTVDYGDLPDDLKSAAGKGRKKRKTDPRTRCLVLLGSAGDRPEWNSRATSVHHKVVVFDSIDAVESAPMFAEMIRELGLDLNDVVAPASEISKRPERPSGVFFVPQAAESPFITDKKNFVQPEQIESVVGFGGMLRNGQTLCMILFSRTGLTAEASARFKTLALDVRAGLFAASDLPTFATRA